MQHLKVSSLAKSLGGRWAISIRGLLIYAPIAILFVPIGENAYTEWDLFSKWTFVAIMSLIPPMFLVLAAHQTVFKNRAFSPLPAYSVIILGFITGFARGCSTALLVGAVGLPSEDSPGQILLRGLNAGVLAAIAFPAISLLLLTWDQWKALRREAIEVLIDNFTDAQDKTGENFERQFELIDKFNKSISERLKSSQSDFRNLAQISMQSYWKELAQNLRNTSSELVRPMSHELNELAQGARPTRFAHTQYMLRNIVVQPHWILLSFWATEFRYFVMNMGLALGILDLLVHGAILTIVALIFKSAIESRKSISILFLYSLLLCAVLTLAFQYSQVLLNIPTPIARNFFEAMLVVMTLLVFGSVSAFLRRQDLEIQVLNELIQSQEIERHLNTRDLTRISQQIVSHLHGGVQSRLMASALAIEKAGLQGDYETLKREVERAYSDVTFDSKKILSAPIETIAEVNENLIKLWDGVINLELNISEQLETLPQRVLRAYEESVTEAISNGFRHGGATSIAVEVALASSNLTINISDNGTGIKSSNFGLGAQLYDVVTRHNWKLESNANGTGSTLTLYIPL